MAKYTLYKGKSISFTSKTGTRYTVANENGRIACYTGGKRRTPTKEILERFTIPGGDFSVYAEGGSITFKGPGGYGVVIVNNRTGEMKNFSKKYPDTTCKRMELQAVINGIKETPQEAKVTVYTSSEYAAKIFSEEYYSKKNDDLALQLISLKEHRKITVKNQNPMHQVCNNLIEKAL